MKIGLMCPECSFDIESGDTTLYEAEITDACVATIKCRRGHTSHTRILSQKFHLLYDSAAWALLDGYPREAVASFAAAVERFHEYVIRVLSTANFIEPETFAQAWKGLSLSERQLGAFRALYLITFKKPAPEMGNADVTFRNNVIHKGEFPSTEAAIEYGEKCYTHIKEIQAVFTEEQHEAEGKLLNLLVEQIGKNVPSTSTMKSDHLYYSILDTIHIPQDIIAKPRSLREWLQMQESDRSDRKRRAMDGLTVTDHDEVETEESEGDPRS